MSIYDEYQITDGVELRESLVDLGYFGVLRSGSAPEKDDTIQTYVTAELRRLCRHFGDIYFGRRQKAPCGAWRSEVMFLGPLVDYQEGPRVDDGTYLWRGLQRYANRIHLFQKRDDKCGRYLGYALLRPRNDKFPDGYINNVGFAYTAVAYLALPSYMTRPRYHIIACMAGPPDGIIPFRAVPYCTSNRSTHAFPACFHIALQTALLLKMTPFGTKIISSQDMVAALHEIDAENDNEVDPTQLQNRGVSLNTALAVLQHENCSGGIRESFTQNNMYLQNTGMINQSLIQLETIRCMTDYIANGIPLIIRSDYNDNFGNNVSHAILAYGMHIMCDPGEVLLPTGADDAYLSVAHTFRSLKIEELPGRFVIQDINKEPYHEIATSNLINRIWVQDASQNKAGALMLAITPRGATVPISGVRAKTIEYYASILAMQAGDSIPPTAVHVVCAMQQYRIITRLYRTEQLVQKYFATADLSIQEEFEDACQAIGHYDFWWSVEGFAIGTPLSEPDDILLWPLNDTDFQIHDPDTTPDDGIDPISLMQNIVQPYSEEPIETDIVADLSVSGDISNWYPTLPPDQLPLLLLHKINGNRYQSLRKSANTINIREGDIFIERA